MDAVKALGGKRYIYDMMRGLTLDQLKHTSDYRLQSLCLQHNLPKNLLINVRDGKQKLTFTVFDKIAIDLNISPVWVFEWSNLNEPQVRASWERERDRSPMFVMEAGKKVPVDTYVYLRASQQLVEMEEKNE